MVTNTIDTLPFMMNPVRTWFKPALIPCRDVEGGLNREEFPSYFHTVTIGKIKQK